MEKIIDEAEKKALKAFLKENKLKAENYKINNGHLTFIDTLFLGKQLKSLPE